VQHFFHQQYQIKKGEKFQSSKASFWVSEILNFQRDFSQRNHSRTGSRGRQICLYIRYDAPPSSSIHGGISPINWTMPAHGASSPKNTYLYLCFCSTKRPQVTYINIYTVYMYIYIYIHIHGTWIHCICCTYAKSSILFIDGHSIDIYF